MQLTEEDLKQINSIFDVEKLHLSIGSIYAKELKDIVEDDFCSLDLAVNEVIGYYVSKEMGIFSPYYKIVIPNINIFERVFVISDNLNNYGVFKTFEKLGMSEYKCGSLYEIKYFLENELSYRFNISEYLPNILLDIIKVYIFDILMGNWDRYNQNWGLIFRKDGVNLAIFDNEFIMDYRLPALSSSINTDTWASIKKNTSDKRKTLKDEIKQFLSNASEEYQDLFLTVFHKFNPNYFQNLLVRLEKEETIITNKGLKPFLIDNLVDYVYLYQNNYNLIEEAIEEFRKENKQKALTREIMFAILKK